MLIKIFSLYIQSLIYTTILVGLADGLWLLLQRLGRKDRTLAVGQSQIYDLLLRFLAYWLFSKLKYL